MNQSANAHGLSGECVQPDWTPLTCEEVRVLLRKFPECGSAKAILSSSPRPFSAASVISADAGRVFVKRHHRSVRDREGLLEEHRFMQHLRRKGAPVPRIYADGEGQTAVEIGDWSYEVHEAPDAVDLYADRLSWTPYLSSAHARTAGRVLAQLHVAAAGFMAPARAPRPLVASFSIFAKADAGAAMRAYLKLHPALDSSAMAHRCGEEALALLHPFHEQLRTYLPQLAPLWTHNDLHGSNLLWPASGAEDQAMRIIDFGLCDCTSAVHDLGHAIERSIVEWLQMNADSHSTDNLPMHLDHLHALLEGYTSVRALNEAECAALTPMAALCHAEFALTEADYYIGILHHPENTRICLEDYLVGRARWMRGPGGQRLLESISKWTDAYQENRTRES